MTTRRRFLHTALASSAAVALPALAQPAFPTRPIKLICPWPAGGSTDAVMRSIADSAGKALGGQITKNPVKEIGWGNAMSEDHAIARHWLGDHAGKNGTVFQWHGETFSIPAEATRLFASSHCANQMFALGPHLGMQCHVEMTPEMIATWCEQWADEAVALVDQPSAQTPEVMQAQIGERLPRMRQLSNQLYSVWINGLRR